MSVRLSELTAPFVHEMVAKNPLVIVPLGCTEQHALHLPLDTDTYQVERLAVEGAAYAKDHFDVDVLVAPTLPYGPASEHYGFPAISLTNETWIAVLKEIVWSLIYMGFRRISVLQGCGGHWAAPGALWDIKASAARQEIPVVLRTLKVDKDWSRLAQKHLGAKGGGHSGIMETSLCLADREHLVDRSRMIPPEVGDIKGRYVEGGEVFLFTEMSSTGALGDPTASSAEAGKAIWREMAETLGRLIARLADQDKELGRL
jgi:creatinine amidohydrolase